MKKYIDADKLEKRVTRLIASARIKDWPIAEDYLRRVIDIISSLQQEQPIGEEYTIEVDKHTYTLRVGSQSDIDTLIRQEKQEKLEGIEGVVHHCANVHYLATNTEQLNSRLKEFEEGAEVRVFIYARKEDEK